MRKSLAQFVAVAIFNPKNDMRDHPAVVIGIERAARIATAVKNKQKVSPELIGLDLQTREEILHRVN